MNFGLYKEILAAKPVRHLFIVGMIARIPHAAAGVLLTLHIVLTLGEGYAAAGAATAVMTIGMAIGAPLLGRLVDTVGLRKALIPSVVAEAVIWAAVPQVTYQWILPLVLLGGLLALPIYSVMRQSLGVLLNEDQRRAGFALDCILIELVFMIGPAAGATAAGTGFSSVALTVVGISTSLAGLCLIWLNPPTRNPRGLADSLHSGEAATVASAQTHTSEGAETGRTAADRGSLAVIQSSGVRARLVRDFSWLSAPVASVLVIAACYGLVLTGTDVGMVAILQRAGHESDLGIVFVFWCGASLIGGTVYGALHRPVSPFLLLLLMAALTMPVGLAGDTWTLAILSFIPGLFCAAVGTAMTEKMVQLVDESRLGEAMGWYGSMRALGAALGAPLTGFLIDSGGPWIGFVSVGALGAAACLVGVTLQRSAGRKTAMSRA